MTDGLYTLLRGNGTQFASPQLGNAEDAAVLVEEEAEGGLKYTPLCASLHQRQIS